MQFRKHIFFYILVILIVLLIGSSYLRFMINHDYVVVHEGPCNEATQNCFIGCTDETCTEKYFYALIQKYAPDLQNQCGTDIKNCESANVCLTEDSSCTITYCDLGIDGDSCEVFTESQNAVTESTKIETI